jgi:probable HAF family extracellular repeat protein
MRRHALVGLTAALLLVRPAHIIVGADSAPYTIVNLGTINGAVPVVTGINASGQVSGYATDADGNTRAVRYSATGGWALVPGLESITSTANAINSHGDLTGYALASDGLRAFRYVDGAGVEFVAPLPGGSYTVGMGINSSGEIVGYADDANGVTRAFRAAAGLPAQVVPDLGGFFALGCGINDVGQVVGMAYNADSVQHAFRAEPDGRVLEVGGFNGAAGTSSACGIDAAGRLAGQASLADGSFHAFLYSTSLTNLDTFGSQGSTAVAVASGSSVGSFTAADGNSRAFLYTSTDGSVDLNTKLAPASGWILTDARAINASGQIAGAGVLNGVMAVFLATPPPPPPPPADTTPPTILSLSASPSVIWPPAHQMVNVTISVSARDNVDAAPSCAIATITADEGSTGDAVITGPLTALVRATKDDRRDARVYTFTVACSDAAGNASNAGVTVTVAKNGGAAKLAAARASLAKGRLLAVSKLKHGKR